jgi:ubiquinone/menaquinone biosynthesis C-methylase UbiE
LKPTGKVLDLGCGSGYNCAALHTQWPNIEITGVDIEEAALPPDYVRYLQVDLDKGILPFADSEFEAVMITHVLEHLQSLNQIGLEIGRVLKPGGLLYVETPN